MTRRILIATLIAMFVSLVNWNSAAAATTTSEVHNIFIATYDQGFYYAGMLHMDGDSYRAIKFNVSNGETFEDMFPANGDTITATVDMDDRGYTNVMHAYSSEYNKVIDLSWSYLDDADIGTIANVSTHDGITDGTVNGDYAQFNGFVTNGAMYLLKEANAYSTNGIGYIIQNGNLISYVVGNGEENPNQSTHKVYMALMVH